MSGARPSVISLADEDVLWETIKELISLPTETVPFSVAFDEAKWAQIKIRFNGRKFHKSLTASSMRGFLEFQRSFYRSVALVLKDHDDIRLLTDDEKDTFEIVHFINDGSTESNGDGRDLLTALVNAMDNMTSRHKLIAVLVLAVLYFGSTGVSQYLKSRDVDLETRQLISAGVKEQKILADAMEKSFQVGTIAAHSDVAYNAVLKHSGDVKNIKINDVQIKRSEIDRIRATTRRSSTTIEFNDTFIILNVDPSTPDGFVVKVKSRSDGIEFRAIIYDGKTSPYTRKAIQQAEWGKTTIRLVISARQIGDQIVDARIVKALPTASKGLLVRQHKRYL